MTLNDECIKITPNSSSTEISSFMAIKKLPILENSCFDAMLTGIRLMPKVFNTERNDCKYKPH